MSETTLERGKIDIGRVIQQTFGVLGRNFVTFFILAVLFVGLPTAVATYLQGQMARTEEMGSVMAMLFAGLLSAITGAILQGALIYGTVQDLNGRRASVGDSLATGLRAFLPLIGLSILLGIAVTFGLILLIVPGLIMICVWIAAVPALVAERRGVFESFGRSADLTRGNRWRIFGLLCIWFVAVIIFSMIIGAATGITALTSADPVDAVTGPLAITLNTISGVLSALVGATGAAVLYVELRKAREGQGSEWLADIFG